MYGRIFESIFDSSIMEEGVHVRYLWHCILVLCGRDGVVDLTREALARRVNMPLTQVNEALECLLAPDPSSRSPLEGGRRIVPLRETDWGWRVVNFERYRIIRSPEDRRTYMREYMRDRRQKAAESKPKKLTRKQALTPLAHASADASTDTEEVTACSPAPPTNGAAPSEFEEFYAAYPKKRAKEDALKAWRATAKKRPPLADLLAAIEAQKKSREWQKDGGSFIPLPATWLRGGRWEDQSGVEGVAVLPFEPRIPFHAPTERRFEKL